MKITYALITGASSGIGLELAQLFAGNGHNLVLVARQRNKLLKVANEIEKDYNIKTLIIPVDLCTADAAKRTFEFVKGKSITVNYLVNNAGFYVSSAFSETSWKDEQRLIQLQCVTHTQLTKLFLPEMLRQGKGGILNIGSTGSFVPGPYNAIYCAAKSFVLSFSEAIAEEVMGSGVTVTALCPGGTKTAFQDYRNRKKSFFFPIMEASTVAKIGFKALMKGKRVVIPGLANRIQVFFLRFFPRNMAARLAGRFTTK